MRNTFLSFICCFWICTGFAQITVETASTHSTIVDGLHCGSDGAIYTTSGGLVNGIGIGKFTEPNNYVANYVVGFSGPIDIDQVNDSMFLVTNYDNNTLISYDLANNKLKTLATGLDGPAGIIIDKSGDAFISTWGGGPAYNGKRIFKYSATGSLSTYVNHPLLYRPQGIAIDHHGQLYISSNGGKVYRVDPNNQELSLFFDLGTGIGNMTYRRKDSSLYFPSNSKIYKVDLNANITVVAGSGPGYVDGPPMAARFTSPLGVVFSRTEDTLYVSEANAGRLRRVILSQNTSFDEALTLQLVLYPNPASKEIRIQASDYLWGQLMHVSMYDLNGKMVKNFSDPQRDKTLAVHDLPKGIYELKLEFISGEVEIRKLLLSRE